MVMMPPLPPLPDVEQEVYGLSRRFVDASTQGAVREMMRDYAIAYGRAVAEAKADAESWAEQADQRTKDAVQFIEERDRLRELLREARFMWVDDHSNLANRIDAALKEGA